MFSEALSWSYCVFNGFRWELYICFVDIGETAIAVIRYTTPNIWQNPIRGYVQIELVISQ